MKEGKGSEGHAGGLHVLRRNLDGATFTRGLQGISKTRRAAPSVRPSTLNRSFVRSSGH
jgi:hypothetical protein